MLSKLDKSIYTKLIEMYRTVGGVLIVSFKEDVEDKLTHSVAMSVYTILASNHSFKGFISLQMAKVDLEKGDP